MTCDLRQIQQIARWVDPRVEPIHADTPIKQRFPGRRLTKFWRACQCESGGRLPDLLQRPGTAFYRKHLQSRRNYVIVLGTLLLLAQAPVADPAFLYMYVAVCVSLYVAAAWYGLCGILVLSLNIAREKPESSEWPLPKDITTFGQVADVLNGFRGGWCKKCHCELTGIEFGTCSQCGSTTA